VHLAEIVAQALKKLPIPKVMRWGDSDHQFVRPVHSLILLHGSTIVAGERARPAQWPARSATASCPPARSSSSNPAEYAAKLAAGKVIASFAERRATVAAQLDAAAKRLDARINPADGLLDEVTALVEWPVVYVGEFEAEYLEVPQECLILTMQQNQKYFPLLDPERQAAQPLPDRLQHAGRRSRRTSSAATNASFARAWPMHASSSTRIARTVSPPAPASGRRRLSQQARLARRPRPAPRPHRAQHCRKARRRRQHRRKRGLLAKVDLLTDMVGEFPELQGIMGRYYLLHEGGLPEWWPTPSSSTTGRALPATPCRRATSPAPPRWPTSSTRWSAFSASASCRPATRIPSACAAPPSACCAS
jgi:glycyl-tRNA synthetase beta chain